MTDRTLTERIRRLEKLRREGVDWSQIDAAMYGPLPDHPRVPAWVRRAQANVLPSKDYTDA